MKFETRSLETPLRISGVDGETDVLPPLLVFDIKLLGKKKKKESISRGVFDRLIGA